MKTPLSTLSLVMAFVASLVLLASCGGGGGTTSVPSIFTATCGDGSYSNSAVSLDDAQSKCPLPKTAVCYDGSTRTSYVSQAVADMLCPSNVIQASTYDANKKSAYDRLNADRVKCGFGSVKQNALLDQAAQNHSNYLMLNQVDQHEEYAWQPGYTGYYPWDRIRNVGYQAEWSSEGLPGFLPWGKFFENPPKPWVYKAEPNADKGVRRLYTVPYHLNDMLKGYREIGIGSAMVNNSVGTETAFKKWFTFDYATSKGQVNTEQSRDALLTFPCDGMEDMPTLQMKESPDPFPGVDREKTPYGLPVYIRSAENSTLTLTSGTITLRGGAAVPTVWLNKANDPNFILQGNQVFLSPTVGLADNSTYDVKLVGTNTGMITNSNPTGAFTREFSFKTSTYTGE